MGDISANPAYAFALARLGDVLRGTAQRQKIAEASGISASTLKDYFTGRTSPPLDRLIAIADAAGIPPGRFFPHDPLTPEEAEKAAPAEAGRARASGPPPLDETLLAKLFRGALEAYGNLPEREAKVVVEAFFQSARAPRDRPEAPPEPAPPPDRPGAPAPALDPSKPR